MSDTLPRNTPLVPRRVTGMICAALGLTTILLVLPLLNGASPGEMMLAALFFTLTVCTALVTANGVRFWWAARVNALIVFGLYGIYFAATTLTPHGFPLDPGTSPHVLGSMLGFCLFGMPAFTYFLWGNLHGPAAHKLPEEISRVELVNHILVAYCVNLGRIGLVFWIAILLMDPPSGPR